MLFNLNDVVSEMQSKRMLCDGKTEALVANFTETSTFIA